MENITVTTKNIDFSSKCRTCLGDHSLNPIFENTNEYKRHSNALWMVAGIMVEINDGLPQKICTDCVNILNNSLKFRKQCKDVETQLLNIKNECKFNVDVKKVTDLNDIRVMSERSNLDIKEEVFNYESTENDDDNLPLKHLVEVPIVFMSNSKPEDMFNILKTQDNNLTKSNQKQKLDRNSVKCKRKTKKLSNKEPPYKELVQENMKTLRVSCKMCLKDLSIRSIDTHMARMHPGADERKVKCDLCERYILSEKLNRHMNMMHGGKNYKCGYCKTDYESKELLIAHVSSCSDKKKKRNNETGRQLQECEICHKTMQRASLRMHKAIKHAGLGPVCEHCGKKFGNKFRLNEHYRAKHDYEKFKCSYCDFQSAGIMSMRNHERRHRGEKPFVCDTCGAKFHAAYLLAQHKQSHRIEKPVKCPRCPARFKSRNGLHAHTRARHQPLARFSCALCARAFRARHQANTHARLMHGQIDADKLVTLVTPLLKQ